MRAFDLLNQAGVTAAAEPENADVVELLLNAKHAVLAVPGFGARVEFTGATPRRAGATVQLAFVVSLPPTKPSDISKVHVYMYLRLKPDNAHGDLDLTSSVVHGIDLVKNPKATANEILALCFKDIRDVYLPKKHSAHAAAEPRPAASMSEILAGYVDHLRVPVPGGDALLTHALSELRMNSREWKLSTSWFIRIGNYRDMVDIAACITNTGTVLTMPSSMSVRKNLPELRLPGLTLDRADADNTVAARTILSGCKKLLAQLPSRVTAAVEPESSLDIVAELRKYVNRLHVLDRKINRDIRLAEVEVHNSGRRCAIVFMVRETGLRPIRKSAQLVFTPDRGHADLELPTATHHAMDLTTNPKATAREILQMCVREIQESYTAHAAAEPSADSTQQGAEFAKLWQQFMPNPRRLTAGGITVTVESFDSAPRSFEVTMPGGEYYSIRETRETNPQGTSRNVVVQRVGLGYDKLALIPGETPAKQMLQRILTLCVTDWKKHQATAATEPSARKYKHVIAEIAALPHVRKGEPIPVAGLYLWIKSDWPGEPDSASRINIGVANSTEGKRSTVCVNYSLQLSTSRDTEVCLERERGFAATADYLHTFKSGTAKQILEQAIKLAVADYKRIQSESATAAVEPHGSLTPAAALRAYLKLNPGERTSNGVTFDASPDHVGLYVEVVRNDVRSFTYHATPDFVDDTDHVRVVNVTRLSVEHGKTLLLVTHCSGVPDLLRQIASAVIARMPGNPDARKAHAATEPSSGVRAFWAALQRRCVPGLSVAYKGAWFKLTSRGPNCMWVKLVPEARPELNYFVVRDPKHETFSVEVHSRHTLAQPVTKLDLSGCATMPDLVKAIARRCAEDVAGIAVVTASTEPQRIPGKWRGYCVKFDDGLTFPTDTGCKGTCMVQYEPSTGKVYQHGPQGFQHHGKTIADWAGTTRIPEATEPVPVGCAAGIRNGYDIRFTDGTKLTTTTGIRGTSACYRDPDTGKVYESSSRGWHEITKDVQA